MTRLRVLYALAIFLASCLLFLSEPMAGKRLVPLFGGSAAVWTACLVFFQTALLIGYCCAHWLARRVHFRAQGLFYLVLLALGLLSAVNPTPAIHANSSHPIVSVFWMLSLLLGVPFVALSAASPLLQAWHARHSPADTNPRTTYRLFALSNFGSLAALAFYPILIEPRLTLRAQAIAWSLGYFLYLALCAAMVFLSRDDSDSETKPDSARDTVRPNLSQLVVWFLLGACGSLLLSAVTSYLSQNIASMPLLWIVPLTMYLLSFIIAFQSDRFLPRPVTLLLLAAALGALAYVCVRDRTELHLAFIIPLFSAALFIGCLFCHRELYERRPATTQLTAFYLAIAIGGAVGAFFVGVLAPLIFPANYELHCALILAAALALVVTWKQHLVWRLLWTAGTIAMILVFVSYVRYAGEESIAKMRNFYGTLRVDDTLMDEVGPARTLFNGPIIHGTQLLHDSLRTTPTTYFGPGSGVGLALSLCCADRPRRVGVIGLGAGTLAAYGRPGDVFRFYDINPLVVKVAHDYFTFLADSKARIEIAPGDARISLQNEEPQHFDVLVLDAFAGDAIPIHLLTMQAVAIYARHLQPGGIIAFHVSNKYFDLAPVVAQEAEQFGMSVILIKTTDDGSRGEYGSDWALVSSNKDFLALPDLQLDAEPIPQIAALRLWTDDYNSLQPILRFR